MAASNRASHAFEWLGFLIIGLAMGWLLGLSVSPLVHIVVSGFLSVIGGLLASWYAVTSGDIGESRHWLWASRPRGAAVWAVCALLCGSAIGAPAGIYARENALFGVDPSQMFAKWKDYGLKQHDVFHHGSDAGALAAGLFLGEAADECAELIAVSDDPSRLRGKLVMSRVFRALQKINDDAVLVEEVKRQCAVR